MPQPELSTLPQITYHGTEDNPDAIIHVHPPGNADSVYHAYVDGDNHPAFAPVPTCFIGWYGPPRPYSVFPSPFTAFVTAAAVAAQALAHDYADNQTRAAGADVRNKLHLAPATLPRRR